MGTHQGQMGTHGPQVHRWTVHLSKIWRGCLRYRTEPHVSLPCRRARERHRENPLDHRDRSLVVFTHFFGPGIPFWGVREHVLGVERIGFGIGCSLFLFFPVAFVEDVGFLFTFASKQYAANLCQGVPRNVTCST